MPITLLQIMESWVSAWEHCYTVPSDYNFRSSGVVPGSFILRFLPSFTHRPRLPIQGIYTYPWTYIRVYILFSGSSPAFVTDRGYLYRVYISLNTIQWVTDLHHSQVYILPCISMVTSLMTRITLWCLIFVCFSHRMMRWLWMFWSHYKAYQCHWTFYR